MTFRKVYYNKRKSEINLWDTVDGQRMHTVIPWVPYVFCRTAKSDITNLDGFPVIKKEFKHYKAYADFCKKIDTNVWENNVKPEIQFLVEHYFKIPDDELGTPELKKCVIDIETHSDDEYSLPTEAKHPIVLATVYDSFKNEYTTYGIKPYTGDASYVNYVYCETEELLIQKMIEQIHEMEPDVITGWYIYGFDLPYIINRCSVIWAEDGYKMANGLSPIDIVTTWNSKKDDSFQCDIAGIDILDYIDLYKKYSPNKLESYSLNIVSNFELGKGKLEYKSADLRGLYHEDWNTFVEYNVIDVVRVVELDEKLGFIKLVQGISLLSKCPMKYYQSVTSVIEGVFLTYYRRNNLCAPTLSDGSHEHFEAAYVKEPLVGYHEWVSIVDITSSYPTAMITLNMGNETYYGIIKELKEEEIIAYTKARKFPNFKLNRNGKTFDVIGVALDTFNKALQNGLFTIAPNGAIFLTNKKGNIASVEAYVFSKRKEAKKKKKEETNPIKKEQLNILQQSLKIVINAIYGSLSVPYSRHFNSNIAAAITSVGRHTIKSGERFVGDFFRKNYNSDIDNVVAIDTDSLQVCIKPYMQTNKLEEAIEISKKLNEYINNRSYNETQCQDYNSQCDWFKVTFNFEVVAKSGIWAAKKKYGCWVVWKEGESVDTYKIIGLDIVRSDSPTAIRSRLREIMGMLLRGETDIAVKNKIKESTDEFSKFSPIDIAKNIGCGSYKEYILEYGKDGLTDKDVVAKKGTPQHIKGVLSYNKLLECLNIVNKYPSIKERAKSKVVYLKPNKYNVNEVTFLEWPEEFDSVVQVDMDKMIEKVFLNKIKMLLVPIDKVYLLDFNDKILGEFF